MALHTVVTISGNGQGVNTITTLRMLPTVATLAERQALAVAVRDRFMPEFKTGCAAGMNWLAITVSRYQDPNDSPYTLGVNIVGGGSTLAPMQLCIMWKLQTGQAGRRGRGFLKVPGLQTGAFSNGVLSSATKVSLDAVMPTINGRWCVGGSESFKLQVFSRVDDALRPVASVSYDSVLSTLRSRRLGTGI